MEPSESLNAEQLERLRSLAGRAPGGEGGAWVVGGASATCCWAARPREIVDVLVEGDAVALARRAAARSAASVVVHERFGTATVEVDGGGFDVAAARRESYARPGALPDVSLGATLRRTWRGATSPSTRSRWVSADGALLRVPRRAEDLRAGVLRVLHDASFVDDPTRLLRLARYAARLGFAPDPHTAELAARGPPASTPCRPRGWAPSCACCCASRCRRRCWR